MLDWEAGYFNIGYALERRFEKNEKYENKYPWEWVDNFLSENVSFYVEEGDILAQSKPKPIKSIQDEMLSKQSNINHINIYRMIWGVWNPYKAKFW